MKAKTSLKWNISDVYKVFVATFVFELLVFVILNILGIRNYLISISGSPFLKTFVIFLLYLIQTAGLLLPLWFFAARKYKIGLKNFGFRWIGTLKTLGWVFFSYIFYIGFGIFVIVLFYNLGIGNLGFEPQRSIFEIFGNNTFGFIIAMIVAIFIAPVVEEIYFRGFVLQTLAKRIGPLWGIVLTALIFAAVHFEFQSIMPLIILSFILNVLYIRTKSIWPGIIFHIFNNSIAFTVLYIFENQYWL